MNHDDEHLKLLSIFHYVVGGLAGLIALIPVIHLTIGLFIILAPEKFHGNGPPPEFLGWIFVGLAAPIITFGWILAAFIFATGRFLARRKRYLFCLVMAGVECIFMPFGTVLGVFTIIVLTRESVKQTFAAGNNGR
jgi:hypothetical protein